MHVFKTSGLSATACFAEPVLRLKLFSSVLLALYGSQLASAFVISRVAANSSHWPVSGTRGAVPQEAALAKRADNARFTFYETGLGACGGWNLPTDFIVALNEEQWDGGSHCWEQITITHEGKSTQAQIVDLCPGCPWGALDMSPGLFSFFASQDLGVIYGAWDYGAGQAPSPAPSSSPSPSPPPPPPTPMPQTQVQSQPLPLPLLPSLSIPVPLPSTSQSSQTSQSTSTTHPSVSTVSSTSVSASTTQGLQSTEVAPLSATQTLNAQDDDDDDVAESLFYDYLSGDGSETNNLQALNLALINMIRAIFHPTSSTSSTPPYPPATE